MRGASLSIGIVAMLVTAGMPARGQQFPTETTPLIGELRLMAVPSDNARWNERLHRAGWIEAEGQVLLCDEFPALYEVLGRYWTPEKTPRDRFAIPDLREPRADRDPNPFGVLGPGDLVTGGRKVPKSTRRPARYYLYTGKGVEGR
jgi:hypothetical protein